MKDMKGTRIRKGSYIVGEECSNLHRVLGTTRGSRYDPKVIRASGIEGYSCCGMADWEVSLEELSAVLVIPRRLVIPKVRKKEIELFMALAGLEIEEEAR